MPILQELNLATNKLKRLSDTLLIGAPDLKNVFFDENKIVHIGNVFNDCNNLRILSLSKNSIGDVNLPILATLENLTILALDATKFKFPPEIPLHSPTKSILKQINLGDNGLSNPNILSHLSIFGQLERLYASNNSFTVINGVEMIGKYLPQIVVIELEDNVPPLCDWIKENQKWLRNVSVSSGSGDDICVSVDFQSLLEPRD